MTVFKEECVNVPYRTWIYSIQYTVLIYCILYIYNIHIHCIQYIYNIQYYSLFSNNVIQFNVTDQFQGHVISVSQEANLLDSCRLFYICQTLVHLVSYNYNCLRCGIWVCGIGLIATYFLLLVNTTWKILKMFPLIRV